MIRSPASRFQQIAPADPRGHRSDGYTVSVVALFASGWLFIERAAILLVVPAVLTLSAPSSRVERSWCSWRFRRS
jgi:hypothetical protein